MINLDQVKMTNPRLQIQHLFKMKISPGEYADFWFVSRSWLRQHFPKTIPIENLVISKFDKKHANLIFLYGPTHFMAL